MASNELSGDSRRSVRPHDRAALPCAISMNSDEEEVDDPGQGELGAVGEDEELADWDDEDEGPPPRVPQDVETPTAEELCPHNATHILANMWCLA